jgi:hypothetical protein
MANAPLTLPHGDPVLIDLDRVNEIVSALP